MVVMLNDDAFDDAEHSPSMWPMESACLQSGQPGNLGTCMPGLYGLPCFHAWFMFQVWPYLAKITRRLIASDLGFRVVIPRQLHADSVQRNWVCLVYSLLWVA